MFKEGFLFTSDDDHRLYFWKNSRVTTFAGDSEGGSRDGTVQFARFYKISGIYMCGIRPCSIFVRLRHRIYSNVLKNTASFRKAAGKLSTAFSVHEKHQPYDTKTMDQASHCTCNTMQ